MHNHWLTTGPNGRPWYRSVRWVIIMLATVLVFTAVATVVVDKAFAGCVSYEGAECPQSGDGAAKTYARKFRHHRYGSSKGLHFTKHDKGLIRRYYRHHPDAPHYTVTRTVGTGAAARTVTSDWWKWPFEAMACSPIYGPGYKANCENANDDYKVWNKGVKEVTKVTIVCGGAAAIGSLKGGGYVGAGKAGGTCLWAKLAWWMLK